MSDEPDLMNTSLPARRGPGRPPVELTDTERTRLVALGALGLNQELAAGRLGIAPKTLRRILKEDEEAAVAYLMGRAEAAEEALSLLWRQARKGQPAAAIFLGKTLAGLRESGPFGEDGAGAAGGGVQINFAIVSSDGEARPVKRVTARTWGEVGEGDGEGGA